MPASVRSARHDDLTAVHDVEVAAGALFATVGMDAVAEDDPFPLAALAEYQSSGRAWVSVDDQDLPVGYLLIDIVDGNAHVEQVTVHPAHARRGRGRALLDAAEEWASRSGLAALTLTTFTDVEWNAPYYRRLGFRDMEPDEVGDELRAVRAREAAHGLDTWPRVPMLRPVRAPSPCRCSGRRRGADSPQVSEVLAATSSCSAAAVCGASEVSSPQSLSDHWA